MLIIMRQKTIFLTLIVVLIIAAAAFVARDKIRTALFDVTGEENVLAQARGLIDYATNVIRPMPNTADNVPVDGMGINP
ncbi:MAG: hypothetical protein HGB05_10210, partial [Chloroflexi bacterium]|nr:hypothetical protein [Chloroflexota bacterium]